MFRKVSLVACLSFLSAVAVLAQDDFVPGHYIDNEGNRIDGFFLLDEWEFTPQEFSFKSASSNSEIFNLDNSSVVQIGETRFEKHIVDIDRSSEQVAKMSSERNPNFKEETLFLEVAIAGDPSLYMYKGYDVLRFFFKGQKQKTPQQLVFKSYRFNKGLIPGPANQESYIKLNKQYQQQIFESYKADGVNHEMVKDVRYLLSELTGLFERINRLRSFSFTKYETVKKSNRWNASVRFGYYSLVASGSLVSPFSENLTFDFPSNSRIVYNIEAEYSFTKNDNISIFLEAGSFGFSSVAPLEGGTITDGNVEFVSSGAEVSLGLKKYFSISDESAFYVKVGYLRPFDSIIDFTYNRTIRNPDKPSGGIVFGAGILLNKIVLEAKYGFRSVIEYPVFNGEIDISVLSLYAGLRF